MSVLLINLLTLIRSAPMKTKNLAMALTEFSEILLSPIEGPYDAMDRSVDSGILDLDQLRLEFTAAVESTDFDWMQFARDIELLEWIDNYNGREVRIHVMDLLHDRLFPDKAATQQELSEAATEVRNFLKARAEINDEWVNSSELYVHLNKDPRFARIREHDLKKLVLIVAEIQCYFEGDKKRHALNLLRIPQGKREPQITSPRMKSLYPRSKQSLNPHIAMCDAARYFYSGSKGIKGTKSLFRSVLDKGGIGFEYSASISCSYDEESMEHLRIEKFNEFERCVVGTDEHDFFWTLYSLEELQGWLALIALSVARQVNNDWKRPLVKMLDRRFDFEKRLADLYRKLAGITHWEYGPVGRLATPEYLDDWRKMHNQALADEFFECVDTGFPDNEIQLPDESNSPISSLPEKDSLFPFRSIHKNPHSALLQPLDGFLYRIEETDALKQSIAQLLEGKNHRFDDLGEIRRSYEADWMENEGIEWFNYGERCLVGSATRPSPRWIMYSNTELEGWIALAVLSLKKKRIGDRKEQLDLLLASRFDAKTRLSELRRKLAGEAPWDFGPVGKDVTPEIANEWQNQHHSELEDDIYSYAHSGSIKYRRDAYYQPVSQTKVTAPTTSTQPATPVAIYDKTWLERSQPIEHLNTEYCFELNNIFYRSDPENNDQLSDTACHEPLNLPSFNRQSNDTAQSNEAIDHIDELASYYKSIVEKATASNRNFNDIRHYFYVRLSLWNSEEKTCFSFPCYSNISGIQRFMDWLDFNHKHGFYTELIQNSKFEAIRSDETLHIRNSNPATEEEISNISVPFEAFTDEAFKAEARARKIAAELSRSLGVDVWSHYAPHSVKFGTQEWQPGGKATPAFDTSRPSTGEKKIAWFGTPKRQKNTETKNIEKEAEDRSGTANYIYYIFLTSLLVGITTYAFVR